MSIDRKQLENDMRKCYFHIIRNEKQSSMIYLKNYVDLLGLKDDLGIEYDSKRIFLNNDKLIEFIRKSNLNSVKSFENQIKLIDEDLIILFKNYKKCFVKNIDYYMNFVVNTKIKQYHKKDFCDIILSFYSEYGNNIYNIVKKIIEGNYIEFIDEFVSYDTEDTTAYLSSNMSSKTSYILSSSNNYTIDNMFYIVHELGHALDNELYKYKQDKKFFVFEDLFVEVSGCMFEMAFGEYLLKNGIESNATIDMINACLLKYASVYNKYGKRLKDEYYFNAMGHILDNKNDFGKSIIPELDNFRDDLVGLIGCSLGLCFVLSKDNKEKSMKEFVNFLCMRKENTFEQSIEELGINYDEYISCKLIKPYIKDRNNELIKKYTI